MYAVEGREGETSYRQRYLDSCGDLREQGSNDLLVDLNKTPSKQETFSAQKGRRAIPKISPLVNKMHHYQKFLNGNMHDEIKTTNQLYQGPGTQSNTLLQRPDPQSSSSGLAFLRPVPQQSLPQIKKSHSQQKLSSRQRFVMQKYNLPIPGLPDSQPPAETSCSNPQIRTFQPGAAVKA